MRINKFSRNLYNNKESVEETIEKQEKIFHKILEEQYTLLLQLILKTHDTCFIEQSYRKYNPGMEDRGILEE
ncbi:MAG: hypothetical protein ACE5KZ_10860 [Candidatus Scalinduaceae bacterium]